MVRSVQAAGFEREAMLDWLRAFAAKARRDPKALTTQELDELARVVARLTPPDDGELPPDTEI